MAKLLSNLLKKEPSFKWKDEQQKAFEDLKKKLSSTPMLKFPNFTKSFKVHTNISDFVISAVLMQNEHLITFENKKLCGAQLQWSTQEKELYVVMCCLKTCQQYLRTHKTKFFMDNVSLKYFEPNQEPQSNNLDGMILWCCWMWS